MKQFPKFNYQNDFENENVFLPNYSSKELHKMIDFLDKKLNISPKDIVVNKYLIGKNKKFYPTIICYHKNTTQENNNLLLTCVHVFEKCKDISFITNIAKEYFKNFDNLYFVLIFNMHLKPLLFFKKETENSNYIYFVDSKNIKPFY